MKGSHNISFIVFFFVFVAIKTNGIPYFEKKPIVVITDLYHPYQDPGDNLDLINGFAMPDIELKAVILDITDSFRKDTADHPSLWKDPRGPREAGIIPVVQLNYIFNRNVRYAIGPVNPMQNEFDKMLETPKFYRGVELFMEILTQVDEPIEVLSFGSARVIAVAYNRNPELLEKKIKKIHLSAGTASQNYQMGSDIGANMIPGGEWNVALDVFAFLRLLKSSLPIALYPCAGRDGGFVKDTNNSYWTLKDMSFLKEMHPQLQCYIDYAFDKKLRFDFLRAMDAGSPYKNIAKNQFEKFHVWETAIWLEVTNNAILNDSSNCYNLCKKSQLKKSDVVLKSGLRPCKITEVRDDGRFLFEYTNSRSNISIYFRDDTEENEKALNHIVPKLFKSYSTDINN